MNTISNLKSESKNEDCRFVVVSPSFTFKVLPYINLDCDRSIFIIQKKTTGFFFTVYMNNNVGM